MGTALSGEAKETIPHSTACVENNSTQGPTHSRHLLKGNAKQALSQRRTQAKIRLSSRVLGTVVS